MVDRALPNPLPGFDVPPLAVGHMEAVWDWRHNQVGLSQPSVSVIISTLNRAAHLDATLHSLTDQRYPHFEVIVVKGPCSDGTDDVLDRWAPRIKHAVCAKANLSMSRNIGIRAAAGDLLAFIDDDAIPEPDWLQRLCAPFGDASVGATGGAIRNWTGFRFQCKALHVSIGAVVRRTTPEALETGLLCPAFTGTNFCIRRELAAAAGMFDEAYAYFLEESDLQRVLFHAEMRLVYVENAEVHHLRAPNAHRDRDRVPSDYLAKMSSIAYFCMKHRLEEDTRHDVVVRLAWQVFFVISEMQRMLRQERVDTASASKRVYSAFHGLRRGIRIYGDHVARASRDAASMAPAPPASFRRFESRYDSALRIALIVRGSRQQAESAAAHLLASALASLGHEATLVESGSSNQVEYRNGYWVHQRTKVAADPRPSRGMTLSLALRELRRVEINRIFDVAVDLDFGAADVGVTAYPWRPFRVRATRFPLMRSRRHAAWRVAPQQLFKDAAEVAARCLAVSERHALIAVD